MLRRTSGLRTSGLAPEIDPRSVYQRILQCLFTFAGFRGAYRACCRATVFASADPVGGAIVATASHDSHLKKPTDSGRSCDSLRCSPPVRFGKTLDWKPLTIGSFTTPRCKAFPMNTATGRMTIPAGKNLCEVIHGGLMTTRSGKPASLSNRLVHAFHGPPEPLIGHLLGDRHPSRRIGFSELRIDLKRIPYA